METFTFRIAGIENHILDLIEVKSSRDIVAEAYAVAIRYDRTETEKVSFVKINTAILKRWSKSGLNYIKTKAWKILKADYERSKEPPK